MSLIIPALFAIKLCYDIVSPLQNCRKYGGLAMGILQPFRPFLNYHDIHILDGSFDINDHGLSTCQYDVFYLNSIELYLWQLSTSSYSKLHETSLYLRSLCLLHRQLPKVA